MANETREPLLEKAYHENCSGCRVEQRKEAENSVPFKKLFAIWIITLSNSLPTFVLFPFLYFMIRDFHIAAREEDVSYYAGYVGSAVMFGRGLTSILWGVVADLYGRKLVIIIGTVSVVVLNALFGLSVNYWMAIVTRFLLGCMNGLVGPMKAYATECCREEHQALAMSTISTAWSLGLIVGPAIGGLLAQPADKYPNMFSKDGIFGRFPYFLPCLCISLINVGASIFSLCIEETLHKHKEITPQDNAYNALESATSASCTRETSQEHKGLEPTSKGSILKNWKLMSTFPAYCMFSFHDMAYSEIFSLWAVSPKSFGGLGYSTEVVGEVLSVTGFGLLLSQFFAYPYIQRILGPVMTIRISSALSTPLLQSYPFIALLSGSGLWALLICASILKNTFGTSVITSLFILQNRAVDQDQRGAANGIAMTFMAISKTIGPAFGGALLSWAEKHQDTPFLPGSQIVYFVLNVTVLVGLILTFKPFLIVASESTKIKEESNTEPADEPQISQ